MGTEISRFMAFATRPCLALLALPFTACGPSPTAFESQFADRYCTLLFSCEDSATLAAFGWADKGECAAELARADTAAPDDFDKAAARACLQDLESVTCDDLVNNAFPEACAQVE